MKTKVQFDIHRFMWGTSQNKNYERECEAWLKAGRRLFSLGYYGRIRDARKGVLRVARSLGFEPGQFTIKIT